MNSPRCIAALLVLLCIGSLPLFQATASGERSTDAESKRSYLGFDLNVYPGDDALPVLRKTFSFMSFWLNVPPGAKLNSWSGKRDRLRSKGFGFVVLYRGRETRETKNNNGAFKLGNQDAYDAADRAKLEGFPPGVTVFLDVEEGGRLPGPYHVYLLGWSTALKHLSYRPGIYCSGMTVNEGDGVTITTADDVRKNSPHGDFTFWVFNDACPPSPGCVFAERPPSPAESGISYASVWQYAQSPRRIEFAAHCPPGYHTDANCYAPGDTAHSWFLDVETATTSDPSNGAGANK